MNNLMTDDIIEFTHTELKKIAKKCGISAKTLNIQIDSSEKFKNMISFLAKRKENDNCYTVFNIIKKKEYNCICYIVQRETYSNKPELNSVSGEVLYGNIVSFSNIKLEDLSDFNY